MKIPDNFIDLYKAHMHDVETPHMYDTWTALWCISAVLGRGVVVARPRFPVHLNMYVILMDDSGLTRKSTAVREATKLAQAVCHETLFITTSINSTTELEWTLRKRSEEFNHASVCISSSELVNILGRRSGTASLPALLVDLYDCPGHYYSPGTATRGELVYRNVYMCFLAACAPAWLSRNIHPDVLDGGFTSRFYAVHYPRRKRKIAWPSDETTHSRERLIEWLVNASRRAESTDLIELLPDALDVFKRWYNRRRDSVDVYSSTFETREDDHVLRIAGLLSVADGRWQITVGHLKESIRLVRSVKQQGAKLFSSVEEATDVGAIGRLRMTLLQCNTSPVTTTFLNRQLRSDIGAERMQQVLAVMHELGLVKKFEHKEGKGRPATLWLPTRRLRSVRSIEEVSRSLS